MAQLNNDQLNDEFDNDSQWSRFTSVANRAESLAGGYHSDANSSWINLTEVKSDRAESLAGGDLSDTDSRWTWNINEASPQPQGQAGNAQRRGNAPLATIPEHEQKASAQRNSRYVSPSQPNFYQAQPQQNSQQARPRIKPRSVPQPNSQQARPQFQPRSVPQPNSQQARPQFQQRSVSQPNFQQARQPHQNPPQIQRGSPPPPPYYQYAQPQPNAQQARPDEYPPLPSEPNAPHESNYAPSQHREPPREDTPPPNWRNFGATSPTGGKLFGDPFDIYEYYDTPPKRSRIPYGLKNKSCGKRYMSIGAFTKGDEKFIKSLLGSEILTLMTCFALCYYYRFNTIKGKDDKTMSEIGDLFAEHLMYFQCPLNELLKRYLMRKYATPKGLLGLNISSLAFNQINRGILYKFMDFMRDRATVGGYTIFEFGGFPDGSGAIYARLCPNEVTLGLIQFLNSMHDTIYQWKRMVNGFDFIKEQADAPAFIVSYVI